MSGLKTSSWPNWKAFLKTCFQIGDGRGADRRGVIWFDHCLAVVLFGALFYPQTLARLLVDGAKIPCDGLLWQV